MRLSKSNRSSGAFTLVEILTAMVITTVIVIALVTMFNTTTDALRSAIKQSDVWETARATFGLLRADVETVEKGGPAFVNGQWTNRVGMAAIANGYTASVSRPAVDMMLQDFYLLSRNGPEWEATVYRVLRPDPTDGVGTLYRYKTNFPVAMNSGNMGAVDYPIFDVNHPFTTPDNRFSKMAEGVIHLRMVTYDSDGRELYVTNAPNYYVTPFKHEFGGEALPGAVDLEMFVLEPDRIPEYQAQASVDARTRYIENHVGNIQMFRTRIPLRKDVVELQ